VTLHPRNPPKLPSPHLKPQDCLTLSILADLSDQQYKQTATYLKFKAGLKMACLPTVSKLRMECHKDFAAKLGVRNVFGLELAGVQVDLTKSLRVLCGLYDIAPGVKTKWKLSVDGRPNGIRSEISVGVTPITCSNSIQSANEVYPLAVYQGKKLIIINKIIEIHVANFK
jgi:hypothetical protein